MSTHAAGCNMIATPLADLEFNKDRRFLTVIPTSEVTVTISSGAPFTLSIGVPWAPIPAPINDIKFTGSGTLIVG